MLTTIEREICSNICQDRQEGRERVCRVPLCCGRDVSSGEMTPTFTLPAQEDIWLPSEAIVSN